MMLQFAKPSSMAVPIALVEAADLAKAPAGLRRWANAAGFRAALGAHLLVPGDDGGVARVLFGLGAPSDRAGARFALGALALKLPEGVYALDADLPPEEAEEAALGWLLGGYRFDRYRKAGRAPARLVAPRGIDAARIEAIAGGARLARDLINTPAGDMGPGELELAVRDLAAAHGAHCDSIVGAALVEANYPMIHAVGRAGPQAPRLIDLRWGPEDAPKVTLAGKGVCFDTGGLDLKSSAGMLLMKKDMGGAANVLGLASMIMTRGLRLRLRVLIPAVENSVASDAFRPGDVLRSRKGLTVEIGNTDAEGRLVLADVLAEASAENPELLFNMATLTGAARVALGPEVVPFYTGCDALAADLAEAARAACDPLWRMPLWEGYDEDLTSKIADLNNAPTGGFAGSVTAALFLRRFVENPARWAHFDIYGWTPRDRPARPAGGECQAARAAFALLERRYGGGQSGS